MEIIILIILLVLGVYLLVKYLKNKKNIQFTSLGEINGGVKTGKTFLLHEQGLSIIKRNRLKWKISKIISYITFHKVKTIEEPLLYSNTPIRNCKFYVPLTEDLMYRNKRFAYGSVILMNEASLIASAMSAVLNAPNKKLNDLTASDKELIEKYVNTYMTHLLKLIGHETRGGTLLFDSQCEDDLHYSFRRSVSNRIFIVKSNFRFPFIAIFKVKELFSTGDNTINVNTGDLEDGTKTYIAFNKKKIYKMYDRYAYSYLTDDLPVENNKVFIDKNESAKAKEIFTLFPSDKICIEMQERKIHGEKK